MPRTRIKICGITDADALRAACDAGADAVGFVFIPRSRRFIEPEDAFALSAGLPPFVASVSLFADAPLEKFMEMEEVCPTTLTQLHGDEDVELVAQCGPGVLKTVRYDAATIADELARWGELDEVDAIVIDLPADPARWRGLVEPSRAVSKPLILSGALTPENVGDAIRLLRPYGVDVSAGVETSPGVKDPMLIRAFCAAVQRADAEAQAGRD